MRITKNALQAAITVAANDREKFAQVQLCKRGLVATDGRRAITVPVDGADALGDDRVAIDVADAARIAKALQKGDALDVDIAATRANGHVALACDGATFAPAKREDAPDVAAMVDQCHPKWKGEPVARVAVDAKLLCELAKALLDEQRTSVAVEIVVYADAEGKTDLMPVELRGLNTQRTALLMPMRI